MVTNQPMIAHLGRHSFRIDVGAHLDVAVLANEDDHALDHLVEVLHFGQPLAVHLPHFFRHLDHDRALVWLGQSTVALERVAVLIALACQLFLAKAQPLLLVGHLF